MSLLEKEHHQSKSKTGRIIDCDIHEMLRNPSEQLLPYLNDNWKWYITNGMWKGMNKLPYIWPLDGGVDRLDAKIDGKLSEHAGSDYEKLKEQVLDAFDIEYGVLTSMFFPSDMLAQHEFATALASAYNDWLIDNWLNKDSRLKGSVCINGHDPKEAAREIDRVGCHPSMIQIMLAVGDEHHWGDPYYHPIYEAAVRNGLQLAFHQSYSTKTAIGFPRYYIEWHTCMNQTFMSQAVSLISNGVFDRFPSLKVMMLEGGFSWVPHLMWRFDQNYRSLRREVPWLKRLPSEYIRDHFRASTQPIEDPDPKHLHQIYEMIGSDKFLVFSTDYPHWDFDSPERVLPYTFSKEEKRKILYDNAKEFYGV